ncbi:MAG TPA: nucleotidyltransferase family protein [Anaerolineales bacterium]|nr:nucleotidyltransferase family protein [Anaerolineales bacterium]
MDAVVLAGGIPRPDEPLYSYSNGEAKALIDVAGKPMVQWVLDALSSARSVERVILIGLSPKSNLTCRKPIVYLSNQGKMLDNIKAGVAKELELNPAAEYVLFSSSDIPAVTGEMVDWLVRTCAETHDDIYYNVVRREEMEEVFPGSKRTYTRLKDMQVCGGDVNVARTAIVNEHSDFWSKIIDSRKSPVSQAMLLGPSIILKLLFRQLTADDVIQRVASKLGLKGRALVCPYPEIGMDVDKPHQLEIMRTFLAQRSPKPSPASGARSSKPKTTSAAKKKAPAKTKAGPAKKKTTRAKP